MKQFIKFLIKVLLLLAGLSLLDYVIGEAMDYVINHIKVGGQARDNYICNESLDDIMVFGSSRAVHHYNATMLEDSLGSSCYNCGEDGNGIILSYGRLHMVEERHRPRIIIYDVNPIFDIEVNDNSRYLGWLKARYNRDGIRSIFDDVDRKERYKMLSHMYRYNSVFLQNCFAFFTGIAHDEGVKGFRPLLGEMDKMKITDNSRSGGGKEFDSIKLAYVNRFIDLCNGSELYFVVSPIWYGMDNEETIFFENLCNNRSINFINFSNNPKYVHQDSFFRDGVHLNEDGANEFTSDLIKEIKLIQMNQNYERN